MDSKSLGMLASILVIVGALNWGLVGAAEYDLISTVLGGVSSTAARLVFTLVGIAGLYQLLTWSKK